MKKTFLLAVSLSFLSGCVAQQSSYSWYHPQGGEYLFAYDRDQCESASVEQGLALTSDIESPFFHCMHERGYYLVDGDVVIQGPETTTVANGPRVTQF